MNKQRMLGIRVLIVLCNKQEGKDSHVIRKEEECLQESLMMVPDCQRRYVKGRKVLLLALHSRITVGTLRRLFWKIPGVYLTD